MNEIFDIKDKVIVVTGGYGHIGSGIVEGLLKFNAKVIVAGRNEDKFDQVFKNTKHNNLYFESFDISSTSEYFKNKYEYWFDKYGKIDTIINNAHYISGGGKSQVSDEDFERTLSGVLGSVHRSIQSITPLFIKSGGGKIINISSMYGHISPNFDKLYKGEDCEKFINPPHYGAGKAGVIQLTKYYASLLGKENIYVNAISPGPFSKQKIQDENPVFIERLKSSNPLHKLGQPEDMIGMVVLLCSNASNFITGQNFCIDGGWTIW